MKTYEFEIHRNNELNENVNIESTSLMEAYYQAKELYPNVLSIVPANPTQDLFY